MEMPVHINAAGGLVRRNGLVLVVHNPRRGWEFPGGQVDMGESVTDALVREIREESGIEVVPTALVGVYSNTTRLEGYGEWEGRILPPKVIFSFLCDYVGGTEKTSAESTEVRWVTPEEALRLVTHPTFAPRLRDMLAYDGHTRFVKWKTDADHSVTVLEEQIF